MILQSLAGLPAFLVYFCTAIVVVVVLYLFVYTRVTPHDEFKLIRDHDPAAAIALGLSLLGFVLPVVNAIAHSANIEDCLIWSLIWSLIALIVQIVVYYVVKIPVPNLSAKIAAGELAAAVRAIDPRRRKPDHRQHVAIPATCNPVSGACGLVRPREIGAYRDASATAFTGCAMPATTPGFAVVRVPFGR